MALRYSVIPIIVNTYLCLSLSEVQIIRICFSYNIKRKSFLFLSFSLFSFVSSRFLSTLLKISLIILAVSCRYSPIEFTYLFFCVKRILFAEGTAILSPSAFFLSVILLSQPEWGPLETS